MKLNLIVVTLLVVAIQFSRGENRSPVTEVTFSGGASLDSYHPSIVVPLLTEAFGRHDIKFNAVYYPSARSLASSNKGITDGELHRIYEFHEASGNRYPNLKRIESPLFSVWMAAFAKDKQISIKGGEDLKKYRIGYYRGRQNIKAFLEKLQIPQKNIYSVTTDNQAFMMMAYDRVDIVLSGSMQGRGLIKANPLYNNVFEVKRLKEDKIYAYIHKKHATLAGKITRTLDEMKADGSFKTIYDRAHSEFTRRESSDTKN